MNIAAPALLDTDDIVLLARGRKQQPDPSPGTMQPVRREERINSLDVLRGFSLLGILLMNITSFALPDWDYMFPLVTVKPVFSGPHAQINTLAWFLRWVLAEGKMRALFSMLFGAGVVLITSRAEERGAGVRTADIFTRRNMWLTILGIAHCYLIWQGDILYFYGVIALLFLFPFRHLKPKTLILSGVLILFMNTFLFTGSAYFRVAHKKKQAEAAFAMRSAHKPLDETQVAAISAWQSAQESYRPDQKHLYENIAEMQKGYWHSVEYLSSDAFFNETAFIYKAFGDVLGMMLIGMALYRVGFLTGNLSGRTYLLCAVISLGITLPVAFWGGWHAWKSGFDQVETFRARMLTFDISRLGGAFGNAAVMLLLVRQRIFRWLLNRLASVGQMALSNYLLTSFCMKMLFVWSPLHWYGYMEYYKLYYVVVAMWLVNLVWSSVWLRFFRFGPVEWLWRSLSYWTIQPMKFKRIQDSQF